LKGKHSGLSWTKIFFSQTSLGNLNSNDFLSETKAWWQGKDKRFYITILRSISIWKNTQMFFTSHNKPYKNKKSHSVGLFLFWKLKNCWLNVFVMIYIFLTRNEYITHNTITKYFSLSGLPIELFAWWWSFLWWVFLLLWRTFLDPSSKLSQPILPIFVDLCQIKSCQML